MAVNGHFTNTELQWLRTSWYFCFSLLCAVNETLISSFADSMPSFQKNRFLNLECSFAALALALQLLQLLTAQF